MMGTCCAHGQKIKVCLEKFGEPLLLLLIRLQMASFFFKSGKTKLDNFFNDDWASTVYLFEEIHPVPGLPAEIAAPLGTATEVGLAVLLAFGLMGRFAALGLLGVTGVIFLTHQGSLDMLGAFTDAPLWALLLAVILVRGPGVLSLDWLVINKCCRAKGASCSTEPSPDK